MKRILRTISYIIWVVFVLGLTNCNDELTTRSSTDVEEETILSRSEYGTKVCVPLFVNGGIFF